MAHFQPPRYIGAGFVLPPSSLQNHAAASPLSLAVKAPSSQPASSPLLYRTCQHYISTLTPVAERVWLGSVDALQTPQALLDAQITHVVVLCSRTDLPAAPFDRQAAADAAAEGLWSTAGAVPGSPVRTPAYRARIGSSSAAKGRGKQGPAAQYQHDLLGWVMANSKTVRAMTSCSTAGAQCRLLPLGALPTEGVSPSLCGCSLEAEHSLTRPHTELCLRMRSALTCLHCLQVGNALEESLQLVQELPLLLQHIAAATTTRMDMPGGRVLIAGTAGYEGDAAVAAVAHLMHTAASSAHEALVQASQHHMALRVSAQGCAAHSAAGPHTSLCPVKC